MSDDIFNIGGLGRASAHATQAVALQQRMAYEAQRRGTTQPRDHGTDLRECPRCGTYFAGNGETCGNCDLLMIEGK